MSNIGTLSLISMPGDIERTHFLKNPDITFFKSVYRRHTNFSKFYAVKKFTDNNSDAFGQAVKYRLDDTIGDLLSKVYLQHKIIYPSDYNSEEDIEIYANLGTNIIDQDDDALNIMIGSNTIFQNSDLYLETKQELLNEMCLSASSTTTFFTIPPTLDTDFVNASLITCKNGSHFNYTTLSGGVSGINIDKGILGPAKPPSTDYFYCIPDFSFNHDYSLAIPLCSLRNDRVDFNVKYKAIDKVINVAAGPKAPTLESTCIKEYIHLDVEEKKRFITNSHEYLIETYKRIDCGSSEKVKELSGVSGLSKYILIVGKPDNDATNNNVGVSMSTPIEINASLTVNLTINSSPLNTDSLPRNIFTRKNLYSYFPGCGRHLFNNTTVTANQGHLDSIGVFPICLEPLNYTQPSGCISSNGIRKLSLNLEGDHGDLTIFIVEYNILYISDGKCQKLLN